MSVCSVSGMVIVGMSGLFPSFCLACELQPPEYPGKSVQIPVLASTESAPKDSKEPYAVIDAEAAKIRAYEYDPSLGYWHEWQRDMTWLVAASVSARVAVDAENTGWHLYETEVSCAANSRFPLNFFAVASCEADQLNEKDRSPANVWVELMEPKIWGARLRFFGTRSAPEWVVGRGSSQTFAYRSPALPGPALCYADGGKHGIVPAKENRWVPLGGEYLPSDEDRLFSAFPRLVPGSARAITIAPVYDPGWDVSAHMQRMRDDLPLYVDACWVKEAAVVDPVRSALDKAVSALAAGAKDQAKAALEEAWGTAESLHESSALRREGLDVIRLNVDHLLGRLQNKAG